MNGKCYVEVKDKRYIIPPDEKNTLRELNIKLVKMKITKYKSKFIQKQERKRLLKNQKQILNVQLVEIANGLNFIQDIFVQFVNLLLETNTPNR